MSLTTFQSSAANTLQNPAVAGDDAAADDGIFAIPDTTTRTLRSGAPPVNHPRQGARTLSAERLADMVHQRDPLILQEYGGESGLASRLRTSLHHGMPDDPQQIQRQRDEFGANAHPQLYPPPFSSFLLHACKDGAFMHSILFLWALASSGVAEAASVAVLGILSIFVASLTYYRHSSQRVLAKNEEMQNILVEVARGGRRMQIPIFHLVVGDIALLESGERVPADGLLVQDHSLYIDESTITGESAAVHVSPAMPFLLSGGKVIQGSGKMLVTGVGSKTERGHLMLEPKEEAIEETPLQVRLNQLTACVNPFGLAFLTLVSLILFIVCRLVGHNEDAIHSGTFEAAHHKVLTLVVVFVLSNGPYLAIALSLTHAMKAMMVDGALVRRLSACETMGSATTICTDEMGLSTLNRMTTVQTSAAGGYPDVEGEVLCPIRPAVAEAVHKIQAAGIKVCLITGEDLATAKALAADCGISQLGIAIEGSTFEGYTAEMKSRELHGISVMASSSPSQFLSFVRNLRDSGEVVAVMASHLSALNEADIGLSMGSRTEAMTESSDIIILDDNFASLVNVVRWGRSIYPNIQKFIQFHLTVNVAALSFNLIAAVSVGDMPLTTVQLLWVNLIMDTLGALALATEPPTDEELQKPPVQRKEHLISNVMVRGLIVQALYQVVILLTLQIKGKDIFGLEGPDATDIITTIVFNAFVLCQLFNMANARKPDDWNILKGLSDNIRFVGIMCITLTLQVIVAEFLSKFASTVKLSWQHWLICIVIGFFTWPVALLGKLIPVP